MTPRTFDSFCSSCSNFVTLNSTILLTVVTAYGLNQLGFDNNMWPLFVTEMHTNAGRLNCANCDTQTTEPVLRNVLNSRFLFIEFPPALMKDINVFEEILIRGAQYKQQTTTLLVLLTTYMNVNFNKMLETLIFLTVLSTVFILNTHPINRLSKAGAALVNTISSIE